MIAVRMRALVGLALVGVMALGAWTAPEAQAKTGGGEVIYSERSGPAASVLLVCMDWGSSSCIAYRWFNVEFGHSSKEYFEDADGFYIPYKCVGRVGNTAYPGNQWIKVTDIGRVRVELNCW